MSTLPPGAPSRFDAILLVIAASLAIGIGVGWLSAVPLMVAIVAGTVIAAVAMIDGLLWHPPVE